MLDLCDTTPSPTVSLPSSPRLVHGDLSCHPVRIALVRCSGNNNNNDSTGTWAADEHLGGYMIVARLILHEILHHSTVDSELGVGQIVDTQNSDGIVAHYPQRTHALAEGNSGLVTANTDGHAWLANNSYYKHPCTNVG
ncbi:hypothetical protein DL766_000875 [Monosporascus sp. MC13-8B]|uniref:Lysine-specific metallo-endopeptidase domain-containing protein n=1 Tax=Monosporascus cannonballus TaxID=155416 RepID=A0ABY0GR86_9PEZI|nr:hypothetical protein DL762_010204 [Monosporascus cannonballus]RYO94089.1 hypothetical protein DL763_004157 [Monosporascus cannonballus]RYP38665.1 hypothetical protein DL766_000875 [Monosporascus sp. MC13-8B]